MALNRNNVIKFTSGFGHGAMLQQSLAQGKPGYRMIGAATTYLRIRLESPELSTGLGIISGFLFASMAFGFGNKSFTSNSNTFYNSNNANVMCCYEPDEINQQCPNPNISM